jgi:replicative DNA helicase
MSQPVRPRSPEAERAVLGCMMLDRVAADLAVEALKGEDFYRESHGRLFEIMRDMIARNEPTEMLAVCDRVISMGLNEQCGGIDYIAQLGDHVPSSENIGFYIESVLAKASARAILTATERIRAAATEGHSTERLVDIAESELAKAVDGRISTTWTPIAGAVDDWMVKLQERAQNPGATTGIPTGFVDLDRMLAGLQPSDLVILAARPAMGKTALALNVGRNCADSCGVGIFSLEMSRDQLVSRLMCAEARVDAGKVRTGSVGGDEWARLQEASERIYNLPLYIDDTPGLTIAQVRSKARRLKALNPSLGLIIVDYIGLMGGEKGVPREQQVAASSRGLKALAKELNITVLCLSQLNRGVEDRNPKIPQLSDLRESGAIEQDADVIMFIYRDEYYNPDSPREGEADVIIAKQRGGSTGVVPLAFQGQFTLFSNLSKRGGPGY